MKARATGGRAAELIRTLGLTPHLEGGHFREMFRSSQTVSPSDARGPRPAVTTIHFLLAAGEHSRWHAVRSDEVWHFYEGAPLELLIVEPETLRLYRRLLGPVTGEQQPVHVVPAGHWQAARSTGDYTLTGCTVAPGFEYADFRVLADDPVTERRFRETLPDLACFI